MPRSPALNQKHGIAWRAVFQWLCQLSKALADFSFPLAVINCSLSALSSVASLVGNGIPIFAMFCFPELRDVPSNLLMVSLAASGLLVGCTVQPIYSIRLLSSMTVVCYLSDNVQLKNVVFFCGYVFVYSSCLSICMITIERYIFIAHSLHYLAVVTSTRVLKVIAAGWLVSVCLASLRSIPSFPAIGMKIITSTLAVLAIVLVLVCYSKMMKISKRHKRRTRAQVIPQHAPTQHDFRGTNTTLIVISSLLSPMFLCCCCGF